MILVFITYNSSLITHHCFAQTVKMPADTEFFYTYGGTNIDEARDIKETPDKGYILIGTTSSFGPGEASVYMIKTDSLGNHVWSSTQGGIYNDHAYAVELTYDHGFFVAGYSNSFYSNNSFDYSAYYFKTDATGHLLWEKFVDNGAAMIGGSSAGSYIYGACAMPDSGFLMCGQTYATASGNADAYLIRVDKNGDTLWTNHYGGPLDEVFNSVCIINNAIYAVGSNGSHPRADSLADGWIVKLNMNGDTLQSTYVSYGGRQQAILNGITPYNDTLFTICGGDYHIDSNATTGIVTRYDTSLKVNEDMTRLAPLWGDTSNGYFVSFSKVINISYGNICAIGYAIGGLGGTNMFFEGFTSLGYVIQDSNDLYLRHSGGIYNDYGYSGILTTGGKIIGVGSTQGFVGMPSPPYCTSPNMGLEDVFLVRFDSDSINNYVLTAQPLTVSPQVSCYADALALSPAAIKNYSSNNNVKLYPNPASANVNLSVTAANNESYSAKAFSVLGEEVMSLKIKSNTPTSIDVSNLSNGTYIMKIQDNNGGNLSILKFIVSR